MAIGAEADPQFGPPYPENRSLYAVPGPNETGLDFLTTTEQELVHRVFEKAQDLGVDLEVGWSEEHGICIRFGGLSGQDPFIELLGDYENDNQQNKKFAIKELKPEAKVFFAEDSKGEPVE